ncbi:hypothetical protein ACFC1D_15325 [Streptomyces vinaceus]|uniref:hypothetical protein n=1 Tax=Streptomyces vinaceus TaxID=1960 RepID=UPI0035DCA895
MKAKFCYYAAMDDQAAGQSTARADAQVRGAGRGQILVDGIDPFVDLAWVEFVLTGRSSRFVKFDPRHGRVVAIVRNGEMVSVSITDSLRDALASVDREFLDDVASNWRLSGSVSPSPDVSRLADFLKCLAALAEQAIADGYRLYCWKCA